MAPPPHPEKKDEPPKRKHEDEDRSTSNKSHRSEKDKGPTPKHRTENVARKLETDPEPYFTDYEDGKEKYSTKVHDFFEDHYAWRNRFPQIQPLHDPWMYDELRPAYRV